MRRRWSRRSSARNALLASMSGVVAKTDQRVLGPGGVVEGTQRAVEPGQRHPRRAAREPQSALTRFSPTPSP
jgi:hypothetical protein